MKYKIVKSKRLSRSRFEGPFFVVGCWKIKERFMFLFWVEIRSFDNEEIAKSWVKAAIELETK